MNALNSLYLPGAVTVWCALFFALACLWGYAQVLRGDASALSFARRGYTFFSLSIVLAAAMLLLALYRRDFRIEYVYQYSGLDLAGHFQMAAFWAGQKGSFLIWLLWGALLGLALRRTTGKDEPLVMGTYLLTLMGLLFILVRENPFVMLPETPTDGAGLNPLLQDGWMVIHPPVMFVGYAATAIPFSFAVAAMWRRDTSRWAALALPWTLGGFLVLGTAILMGGYWAYKTLGWGGYWGWDPVENASLIPWLIGVVLVHGLYLERSQGRYRRLNLLLACALYMSVLYGTFLTRSGVLADFSVHSFVDLGISGWLVATMAFFGLGSVYLLATRWSSVETVANEDPLLSRGTAVVLGTIAVSLTTLVVTFGTSAPLITRYLRDNPSQVGPEFYNTVNLPLALLIAFLLACVPFLNWKASTFAELGRQLLPSFVFAIVAAIVALGLGVREPFELLFVFLASWALGSNLNKVIVKARQGGLSGAGGYLSHVGVGIMLIGILASSAYDESVKLTLEQGRPMAMRDKKVTFIRYIPREGAEKERMEVSVQYPDGTVRMLYPKLFVNDRTRQTMVNPDIFKTFLRDLYISPLELEAPEDARQGARIALAKGELDRVGNVEIRFVDFAFDRDHDPMVLLASGQPVTIRAKLEASRAGQVMPFEAIYRFRQDGQVETPPIELPGSGFLALTGIDPQNGRVQVDVIDPTAEPRPARLSVDITEKPLISLVWGGLYVILAGGLLSVFKRARQARLTLASPSKSEAA